MLLRVATQIFKSLYFTHGYRLYNCMEQYMMSLKARIFKDYESEMLIMGSTDPKAMKKLGRNVRGFDVVLWHNAVLSFR
jgi:predicted NAD-dependent protein-ADP-ribosyltransferase YbiA (DUF1768 family)